MGRGRAVAEWSRASRFTESVGCALCTHAPHAAFAGRNALRIIAFPAMNPMLFSSVPMGRGICDGCAPGPDDRSVGAARQRPSDSSLRTRPANEVPLLSRWPTVPANPWRLGPGAYYNCRVYRALQKIPAGVGVACCAVGTWTLFFSPLPVPRASECWPSAMRRPSGLSFHAADAEAWSTWSPPLAGSGTPRSRLQRLPLRNQTQLRDQAPLRSKREPRSKQ